MAGGATIVAFRQPRRLRAIATDVAGLATIVALSALGRAQALEVSDLATEEAGEAADIDGLGPGWGLRADVAGLATGGVLSCDVHYDDLQRAHIASTTGII